MNIEWHILRLKDHIKLIKSRFDETDEGEKNYWRIKKSVDEIKELTEVKPIKKTKTYENPTLF
jgi:hypothetical protein